MYEEDVQGSHEGTERAEPELKSMTFEELIEKITEDCFRFFGFRSFDEVDRLTFPEYELLCKAHKLSTVDKDMWVHKLAYLNFMAKASRKAGKTRTKPVYETFDKFYDYQKALDKVEREYDTERNERFLAISRKMKEERREE